MVAKKEVAVAINNIHKEFILPQSKNSTFKQTVVNIVKKNKKITQKVLDGVGFNVYKGDFLGIIGRNGCGKSTLLKIIAGVYSPQSGNIQINGGLTPFIELGVGFNPELSGRDNVFLNGALLGFNRKQMNAMYDEIVAFAEIEPFMDQKLKNYSSGMQVRLAFSIAIKAENDILIFDEVLAVGDSNFQEKCVRQFTKLKKEGKTIILVSHAMGWIEKFCNRVVLLNEGKVEYDGDVSGAIDRYEAINIEGAKTTGTAIEKSINDSANKLTISSVDILGFDNKKTKIINGTDDFSIKINIKARENINDIFAAIRICESINQFPLIGFDSEKDKKNISVKIGDNQIIVKIKNNPILRGKFYIIVGLYESPARLEHFGHYNSMQRGEFFLVKNKEDVGIVKTNREWM